jgi:hypothetical protein
MNNDGKKDAKTKKLILNRQTIRQLTVRELGGVAGGGKTATYPPACDTAYDGMRGAMCVESALCTSDHNPGD